MTLFSLDMYMFMKSAEPECRGPNTISAQWQPHIREFMYGLIVTTDWVPDCLLILHGLEKLVEWARMRFKPEKSTSMVLRKGRMEHRFRFNTAIQTITEKSVKSFGQVLNSTLRDTAFIQSTCTELDGWKSMAVVAYLRRVSNHLRR